MIKRGDTHSINPNASNSKPDPSRPVTGEQQAERNRRLAALHELAERNKERILTERKGIFKLSKDLKMELDALGRQWPEYEAKAKVAAEEEKKVAAEWSRIKDFISSLKD